MALRDYAQGLVDRLFGAAPTGARSAPGAAPAQATQRFAELDALDRTYHAEQYARRGLAVPWDKAPPGSPRTPLRLQRPAVQFALAKIIVDRPTGMLFGEGRFPRLKWEPALEDETEGHEKAEDKVTQWLTEVVDEGHLAAVALIWARLGGSLGSGVLSWAVVEGKFEFTAHKAHHCEPTFHPRTSGPVRKLLSVDKRYKFKKLVDVVLPDGMPARVEKDFWHREVWDAERHVVYKDVPDDDKDPVWVEAYAIEHGFGFVPMVWVKNLDDGDPGTIDGVSLLDQLPSLLEDVDRALTGLARGVRYNTEPERVYTGVPMDPDTRKPLVIGGGATTSLPEGADAKLLEITGAGLEVAQEHIHAQRGRALEVARVVLPDPERLLAASRSGAALRILFASMLELVGELRQSYGAGLRELLSQIIRAAQDGKLKSLPDEDGNPGTLETPPPGAIPKGKLVLQWGPYFEPTPEDLKTMAETAVALLQGGVLDRETIVRTLADEFGIRDVDAVLAAIDEEQAQKFEQERQQLEHRVQTEADNQPPPPASG